MAGDTMRAWRVVRHGAPTEALQLDEVPVPEPGPGEVRVRTLATALNFNEIDGCRGRYLTVDPPLPYTLGMEVLGEVEAAGPGAEAWVGRRVMATAAGAHGGHAERVIAPTEMVFEAPASLSDVEAAAFFFPFHLAWLGLHTERWAAVRRDGPRPRRSGRRRLGRRAARRGRRGSGHRHRRRSGEARAVPFARSGPGHRLPRRRLRRRGERCHRRPRGGPRLRRGRWRASPSSRCGAWPTVDAFS